MPVVDFSSGQYRATDYDKARDIYTFKNIRFAAPPTGDLRFRAPVKPARAVGVQDGKAGASCLGSIPAMGPLKSNTIPGGSEDCLFLDVYVPGKQFKAGAKPLPVINWIYGGAYLIGAKDQIYKGGPLVSASGNNLVFVSGNYRLGAFGFAAGTTVENDGTANAAFYDQRMVFEWIRDEISKVGGDPKQVTAMGESAGAGSIQHHLTAFGGKQDPLFRKAIIQSPAFQPYYERTALNQQLFERFAQGAGCTGADLLACVRKAPAAALQKSQVDIINSMPNATYGFGPTSDGKWVRQLSTLEFASGNYFKDMDGLIVSHVQDEARIFIGGMTNDAQFDADVPKLYPNAPAVQNAILKQYPTSGPGSKYPNIAERDDAFIGDSVFRCNVRFISDAYKGKAWNMQYSHTPGIHGTDIIPDHFYADGPLISLNSTTSAFMRSYQSYLTSFAMTGDPNTRSLKTGLVPAIDWPKTSNAPGQKVLGNVLEPLDDRYRLIDDVQITSDNCGFWVDAHAAVTQLGGWAPPGAVVKSSLLSAAVPAADASKNYGGA
ncbi:alpha/beta-hydrolase [Aulographum hederae CBS 113979]|uniref:Alpha/beta-hydrolase n=1 Tax=Aulographum hederae CBS 113979 TaxID=1176131 RepID=A0A6G1HA99_9PEZI|nr:alpha/beta-hydrolase [Aulographum hederae CBS 113979]